jgi:hypothetical protein
VLVRGACFPTQRQETPRPPNALLPLIPLIPVPAVWLQCDAAGTCLPMLARRWLSQASDCSDCHPCTLPKGKQASWTDQQLSLGRTKARQCYGLLRCRSTSPDGILDWPKGPKPNRRVGQLHHPEAPTSGWKLPRWWKIQDRRPRRPPEG